MAHYSEVYWYVRDTYMSVFFQTLHQLQMLRNAFLQQFCIFIVIFKPSNHEFKMGFQNAIILFFLNQYRYLLVVVWNIIYLCLRYLRLPYVKLTSAPSNIYFLSHI